MSPMCRFIGWGVSSLVASAALADGFVAVGQDRHLLVQAAAAPCGKEMFLNISAADFAPFDESAHVERACIDFGAFAHSEQVSSIEATLLEAIGLTTAATQVVGFEFVLAFSDSSYRVEVELVSPARVRIAGVLAAMAEAKLPPSYLASASVALFRGFEPVFEQNLDAVLNAGPMSGTVSEIIRLEPETYTVRIDAQSAITDAFPTTGSFSASYDVTIEAFHLADIDLDGIVDISDLLLLLAQWGVCRECFGDVDGDGVVDIADLLVLLAAWGVAGP